MMVYIDGKYVGRGKLYVTDFYLSWVIENRHETETGLGFRLEYNQITSYSYKGNDKPPDNLYIFIDDFEVNENSTVAHFVTVDKASLFVMLTAIKKLECAWERALSKNDKGETSHTVEQESKSRVKASKLTGQSKWDILSKIPCKLVRVRRIRPNPAKKVLKKK